MFVRCARPSPAKNIATTSEVARAVSFTMKLNLIALSLLAAFATLFLTGCGTTTTTSTTTTTDRTKSSMYAR